MIPAGVLQYSAPLTVRIVVSHEVGANENQIYYGVSDGISFFGFGAVDRAGKFVYNHPCVGAHGFSGARLTPIPTGYSPRGLSDSYFPVSL